MSITGAPNPWAKTGTAVSPSDTTRIPIELRATRLLFISSPLPSRGHSTARARISRLRGDAPGGTELKNALGGDVALHQFDPDPVRILHERVAERRQVSRFGRCLDAGGVELLQRGVDVVHTKRDE